MTRASDVWHLMIGQPDFVRLMPGFYKMRERGAGRDVAGTVEVVGTSHRSDRDLERGHIRGMVVITI